MIGIYHKDGTLLYEAKKLEYNGEFMGECSLTLDITSPVPLDFQIGDYATYRGERFEINYDPSVIKYSRLKTNGETFKYDSVKLNSLSDELVRCMFLDYVSSDNNIHYTSLPTFSFYASDVSDLAERIQVNLDRLYPSQWTVQVADGFEGKTNISVSVDSINCWEALALANSEFGANFIVRGRVITIGAVGITVGHLFTYGKGNGLYTLERTADSDQEIITRLRAYGNTTNMPQRYYNNLSTSVPNNMAVQNLMLPGFPDETINPYIDSDNIDELGIREATVFFNGSDSDLDDIFPTMEGMTAQDLIDAGYNIDIDDGDNGNLDEIVEAEQIEDEGIFDDGDTVSGFTITLKDIGFDINDYLSTSSATISMKDGMCGSREFEIVSVTKEGNKYILDCNRVKDDSLDMYFPNVYYNLKAGDKFVLLNIEMPDVYIKAASQRLLEAATAYLKDNDYTRYTYKPTVCKNFMARERDKNGEESIYYTIKEGDVLMFEDDDLHINGSIIIDTLSITEGDGLVPQFEITLRDDKVVGTIEKIQDKIDSISSGSGSGSGGLTTQQVQNIVRAVGNTLYLSKTTDDTAAGEITFQKGAKYGKNFITGLLGQGARITGDGYGEMRGLTLWEWLEVPELRYNRVSINTGIDWDTFGGGIIESVEIDTDDDGNELQSGVITLKLEDGEFGAIKENDLCMGIFHNYSGGNDEESEDQHNGNFHFAGFQTVYFRVDEILDTATNGRFHYVLRGVSENWTQQYHPTEYMHFAAYANTEDEDRQNCRYATTKYVICLKNMNTWEYGDNNIYYIQGELTGFTINGRGFEDTGVVLGNAYFYGSSTSFDFLPCYIQIDKEGDEFLSTGETKVITCYVYQGFEDVSNKVTLWTVTRETGDQAEDDAWNAEHTDFAGIINISYDDLATNYATISTLFRFTATIDDEIVTYDLTIG